MAEKDLQTVTRRIASISNHLVLPLSSSPSSPPSIQRCNASMDDSYHRIHGEVLVHAPSWRIIATDDSGKEFTDIIYEKAVGEAIAKITINRPERRNAFRPQTVKEMMRAFNDARDDSSIGVIILTGKGKGRQCFRLHKVATCNLQDSPPNVVDGIEIHLHDQESFNMWIYHEFVQISYKSGYLSGPNLACK